MIQSLRLPSVVVRAALCCCLPWPLPTPATHCVTNALPTYCRRLPNDITPPHCPPLPPTIAVPASPPPARSLLAHPIKPHCLPCITALPYTSLQPHSTSPSSPTHCRTMLHAAAAHTHCHAMASHHHCPPPVPPSHHHSLICPHLLSPSLTHLSTTKHCPPLHH